jgi:lipopolysaccharide/colanic/teichoic acid biosynthesis glycosyltransferase
MIQDQPTVRTHQSATNCPAWLPYADALAVALASVVATLVRGGRNITEPEWLGVIAYFAVSGVGIIALNFARRQYRYLPEYFGVHDAIEIAKNVLMAVAIACLCAFILQRMDAITRGFIVIQSLLSLLALLSIRDALKAWLRRTQNNARWDDVVSVLVVGISPLTALYVDAVEGMGRPFIKVVGVVSEGPDVWATSLRGKKILGSVLAISTVMKTLETHGVNVNRIVIALPRGRLSRAAVKELRTVASHHGAELEYLGEILGIPGVTENQPVGRGAQEQRTSYSVLKRSIDVVGALSLLIFLAPVLVAAAVLVAIDVGWPVVFWQDRPGRFGVPFRLYKFRTMRAPIDSKDKPVPLDQRTSRLGKFIRRIRIDELLQLFNVLVGQMSLIGPRPLLPPDQPDDPDVRLSVRPGVTGWAQVNGGRLMSVAEKTALDAWYTENLSPLVDLKIIVLTFKTVFFGELRDAKALASALAQRPATEKRESAEAIAGGTASS